MSGSFGHPDGQRDLPGGTATGSTTGAAGKDTLSSVKDDAQAKASDIAEQAKAKGQEIASAAREQAEGLAEQGKSVGAERAEGLAHAVRRVADDLEDTSPEIARHVRAAADSVEGVASSLRERSVGDLIAEVNGFARRQPAAFFGAAVLAGFAVSRFAKSSAPGVGRYQGSQHQGSQYQGSQHQGGMGRGLSGAPSGTGTGSMAGTGTGTGQTASHAPGWVSPSGDATSTPRPVTMPAATLGGAAAHKPGTAQPGSMPSVDGATS